MTEQQQLEKRIRGRFVKAFATYGLLCDGDRVLVGLSGGKDSLCLLEMLARRAQIHHPRFSVEAIHVRMTNVDYRTSTGYLEQFCASLGVPLHIVTTSFPTPHTPPSTFNPPPSTSHPSRQENLPQWGEAGGGFHSNNSKPPCFLCSWQRRKQLFNLAQELGCNKIALGHHQDDLLVTALMNLFFQSRFETMPPLLQMEKMPLQIIRPLCLVPEADIIRYAELRGYEKLVKLCPHENDTQRTTVRRLLDDMVSRNPETRHSLWNAIVREWQHGQA